MVKGVRLASPAASCSSSSSSSNSGAWSLGVPECWSNVICLNCVPLPHQRTRPPLQGGVQYRTIPRAKALVYSLLLLQSRIQASPGLNHTKVHFHSSATSHLSPFTFHLSPSHSHTVPVNLFISSVVRSRRQ